MATDHCPSKDRDDGSDQTSFEKKMMRIRGPTEILNFAGLWTLKCMEKPIHSR
jgi:hypothetical protein